YCRDKSIRRELKREIKSPYEDPGLSVKAWKWLSDADKRRNINHNRSKRKILRLIQELRHLQFIIVFFNKLR
ncbi:MAG: hypothetical protein K2I08_04890, partial [Muribaculaceae bacterium]|nr:hypothetical protein [Muribaculaceae bacterium]